VPCHAYEDEAGSKIPDLTDLLHAKEDIQVLSQSGEDSHHAEGDISNIFS
jgi:hypothetical protein